MASPDNLTKSLMIQTATHAYPILFGEGTLGAVDALLAPYAKGHQIVIITDDTVAGRYLAPVQTACERLDKIVHVVCVAAGEASKSFTIFQRVCEEVLAFQPDRKTLLVALGGGVVGDLTGFVASVLLRGLPFVQIPTTLLSQVDSSVGGKTAINCAAGKNLIGSFYPPKAVVMDIATLDSLPQRELLAGYGEVLKYGLLGDAAFFERLLREGEAMLAGDRALRCDIIRYCCAMKAAIVEEDEKEQGKRALLNLGHTFGHAIEKLAGYGGGVLHGEAVALGCLMAMTLSAPDVTEEEVDGLRAHYRAVGLPCRMSDLQADVVWDAGALTHACYGDKKASDGGLTFVILRAIGDATVQKGVDAARVQQIFEQYQ
jgi:3-dehydroquinate synthase